MKLTKVIEANNEMTSWNELQNLISGEYEIRNQVDKILEINPLAKVTVSLKLEIEVK